MKRLLVPAVALLGFAFAAPAPASADSVTVRVGQPGYHHQDRHHGYRAYDRARCRIVVSKRWHHGRRVVVRKRVCW